MLEHEEQPNHPFTLFNLGMTYADMDEHEEAVEFLHRSIARAGPEESHLRKAYALLVQSYKAWGRRDQAWDICQQGLERFPHDAELLFRAGLLLQESGQLQESLRMYERLLTSPEERHLSSVDRGIRGFRARHNMAMVYRDLGDPGSAESEWRQALEESPKFRPAWRGLGELLLKQARHDAALSLADEMCREESLWSERLVLRARTAIVQGASARARTELEAAMSARPGDLEPLRMLCQLLFEQGEPTEARAALTELVRRDPEDAAAYHNLGTVHFRLGDYESAAAAYRESLGRRPGSASTYLHLGYALQKAGRMDEAVAAWQKSLELAPDNAPARKALQDAIGVPA